MRFPFGASSVVPATPPLADGRRRRRAFGMSGLAAVWAAVLVGAVVVGAAWATPFTDSLVALDSSVDARVAALPATGGTPAERTERKQLVKVSTALGKVTGADLSADAPAIRAAATALRASHTADAGVVAATADAIAALLTELNARRTELEDAVLHVQSPTARAKALKILEIAAKLVDRATALTEGNESEALKLLATALVRVASADASLESLPLLGDPPAGISAYRPGGRGDFYVVNQTGSTITIQDIAYDVTGSFYDGSRVSVRLTQRQLLAKFQGFPPSADVLTNDTYDGSAPLFVSFFKRMEKQRGSNFSGFTGRAIVRIVGQDPFVVAVSGR